MFLHPLLATKATAAVVASFKTFSYTGTGSAQSFTTPGFKPDLVVIYSETNQTLLPQWPFFDSSQGTGIYCDFANVVTTITTDAQSLTSFDTSGFTVGTSTAVNNNTTVYQAFCWCKGTGGLFDLQTYTGNLTNRTISHSLGITPPAYITNQWTNGQLAALYHANFSVGGLSPQSGYDLITSAGPFSFTTDTTAWNNTAPTSSVFSLGGASATNGNTKAYSSYLFGSVANNSAFGVYQGNGSSTGPTVSGFGFTPTLVMIAAQISNSQNIRMVYGNTASGKLNVNGAKVTTNFLDLVSGGFNVKTTNADFNSSLINYTYSAWA